MAGATLCFYFRGDQRDNFMKSYVKRNALFLVKISVFHLKLFF